MKAVTYHGKREVTQIKPGDRVVIPFNISCGHCYMCDQQLYSQCETTQVHEQGKGAVLLGYTKLYGQVPGGQAELLRVPQAHFGPIKVPDGPPDERFVYLSDVLPTAWQGVEYAAIPEGGTVAVVGLDPIGQMCCRIALHRGASEVFGIDLVDERLEIARRQGPHTIDVRHQDDIAETLRGLTDGRGSDSVIDAVGMEAHGPPLRKLTHQLASLLPDAVTTRLMEKAGLDRLSVLRAAIDTVRSGGTISLSGVYGGAVDPMPMMDLFDKQIQLRMGQPTSSAGSTNHAAVGNQRGAARGRGPFHPHAAARSGPTRLGDLPEEGRWRGQDPPSAVARYEDRHHRQR